MPNFRPATVDAVTTTRPGLQYLEVTVEGQGSARAYALTEVTGPVTMGDRVVLNTTAVDLRLGTGGLHVVHWNLSRNDWLNLGHGHEMKARYTSGQVDVGATENSEGFTAPQSLENKPVVACLLHSQMAMVIATFSSQHPDAKIAYVVTDTAALPIALSDLTYSLRTSGLLNATVTAGQAFGGDYEAVNVSSALGVASKVTKADLIVVGPGPGLTGTGTPLGFSSLNTAFILSETKRYGGTAGLAVRWSDADERSRHRGVSHHSRTVLDHTDADLVLPVPPDGPSAIGHRSTTKVADQTSEALDLLAAHGIEMETMGRSPTEDPGFFAYASAAGTWAGLWHSERYS